MKIFKFTAVFCAFALSLQTSFALKIDDTTIRNPNRFGIQFPNGTAYYGAANKIVSISKQSFFVDASPVLVTEICIELDQSPLQVRIYNARIIGADEMASRAADSLPAGLKPYANPPESVKKMIGNAAEKTSSANTLRDIRKNYPATTHARTLEFIVEDIDELNELFDTMQSHFTGKPKSKLQKISVQHDGSKTVTNYQTKEVETIARKTYIVEKKEK